MPADAPQAQNLKPQEDARLLAAAAAVSAAAKTTPETVEAEKPGYLALKYTFSPSRGDMGGAFCLIFDGTTGETVLQSLWVTRPYTPKILKPNRDWRTFVRIFPQLGAYDKMWGDKLNTTLSEELLPNEERIQLFAEGNSTARRRIVRAEGEIRRGFERATQCLFNVACDSELLTRSDLERAKLLQPLKKPEEANKEEEAKQQEEEQSQEDKSFEGTVIQCLPRVDPVNGKNVTDIVPGDILEVGIKGDAGTSALIQKYLETTHQTPVFPVEEIDKRDDKTYIYLRISDEVRGLLIMTKNLRLKTNKVVTTKNRYAMAIEDLLFFAVLGIALIGLLLAVRYFFF